MRNRRYSRKEVGRHFRILIQCDEPFALITLCLLKGEIVGCGKAVVPATGMTVYIARQYWRFATNRSWRIVIQQNPQISKLRGKVRGRNAKRPKSRRLQRHDPIEWNDGKYS
ncbi:MAG: hypothetical protein WCB53_16905 [Terriglobales bacterium]